MERFLSAFPASRNQATPSSLLIERLMSRGTGKVAAITLPFGLDLISRVPPSCRILSCIPRRPTPPEETNVNSLDFGMPRPESLTSIRNRSASCTILIEQDGLPEWRWILVKHSEPRGILQSPSLGTSAGIAEVYRALFECCSSVRSRQRTT